ncbi:dihydrolipoamide acetyltransferase family protein [Microbacterium gorillae]|uniref:dihydrolipoamide acetyltransferase family protein n=1 Tax=Microbacterium gorillae TaxID=1231063 RepID=UPI00058E969D|nr:dihydrolipoamide acetyltransferase family protein [Microbacterium gorillae]
MSVAATSLFRLPDLGEGLTEAALVTWLVHTGDEIAVDQAVAEVETAKSVVELPSPFAGRVVALHGEPGDVIRVGAPVLEVDSGTGDPAPEPDRLELDAHRAEERAGSGNVLIGYGTSGHDGPARRHRAPRADTGPIPVPEPVDPGHAIAVRSPLIRRLARDLGLDLHAITGTGTGGVITRADVLAAATDSPAPAPDLPADLAVATREPFSMLRRAVSDKLTTSRREIPEATVWVDVDATRLWDLRAELRTGADAAPSLTALLAKFVLLALREYPLLASRVGPSGDELITFDEVNLGIATDTPRGLVVPRISRAGALTLSELDRRLSEIAAVASTGHLAPADLAGSTFTLNNYGSFGVDGSAAIINHPEVAILGVGRIIPRPWVVDGQIVPRRIGQLSLVFDHRVCDGGYAAGFLRHIVGSIEHPLGLFRGL